MWQNEYQRALKETRLIGAKYRMGIKLLADSGMTLREIGKHFGVSHQRIHAIVQEVIVLPSKGGRRIRLPRTCNYCQRSEEEVKELLAGPDVYICSDCTAQADRVIATGRETKSEFVSLAPFPPQSSFVCPFCSKSRGEVESMAGTIETGICNECVALLVAILGETSGIEEQRGTSEP